MPSVVLKGQALEQFFEECVDFFYEKFPGLARELDKHVSGQSHCLHRQSGMSDDGNFKLMAAIPQFMISAIKHLARTNFNESDILRDPANYRLLVKVWKRAKIRTKPTPFFDKRESACPPSTSPSARPSSSKTVPTT